MQSGKNGVAAMQDLLADAREYGAQLAGLLEASSLTSEEKEAWAALVPEMDLPQMQLFEAILLKDMENHVQGGLSHVLLEVKAELAKRDLAVSAAAHVAAADLRKLEAQLVVMERAGGKRD